MDKHENDMKKLVVYGYVKGSSACDKRPLKDRIKQAMMFVGLDVNDELMVDVMRKAVTRLDKDAKG